MFATKTIARKLKSLLASRACFYGILGFFIFEALWFVYSAKYPMPFDEDFHLGIIRIYAAQWSPFLTAHPAGADVFGAVVRDPSYLFHYLMSFPYRLLWGLTHSEVFTVIGLRLINVALFAWGIVLFRKVLLRAKTSPAVTHAAMAVFVLIPIVPQLAAHINYDNLLMPLVAGVCLVTFRLTDGFREQRLDVPAALTLIGICLFTSVVKYASLPLLLAAVLFVVVLLLRAFWGRWGLLWRSIGTGYKQLSLAARCITLVVFLLGGILFVQRYGVNIARYGDPVPDCAKVLTVEQCTLYGPWGRDHYLEQNRPAEFKPNIAAFTYEWVRGMRHRLFFAVNGAHANFQNRVELPVPVITATVIFVAGLIALVWQWRRVFAGNPYYVFFAVLIGVYTAVLFAEQYGMFAQTGVPVAINGRYLVPVLLPMGALLGTALALSLRKPKLQALQVPLVTLAFLGMLHGGGIATFILRSDVGWYWQDPTVWQVNDTARKLLAPITIEGNKDANWQ